ncbi:MAG: diguanylate cyclase [Myxococcota bacterium]
MSEPDGAAIETSKPSWQLAVLDEIARIGTLALELRDALQRITDILRTRFEWDLVTCLSLDREHEVLTCEALSTALDCELGVGREHTLGDDILGHAVRSGTRVLLDGSGAGAGIIGIVPGVPSELSIPIKHDGQVIALLHLGSARWAAFRDQLPLLGTVASQVATAIASATRFEELRRRAQLTEMMSQVSRVALEASARSELLQRIVGYITDTFPVAAASILMLDENGQYFDLEISSGPLELRPPGVEQWTIDIGVAGRCARTGQPQLVVDVTADADYVPGHDSVCSEFLVPIRYGERVLGVLNLESTESDMFTKYVQTVFTSLADQIAGAVNLASVNQRLVETNRLVEEQAHQLMEINAEFALTNVELEWANAELERLSSIDGLTEVANRRHFEEVLDKEWRRAFRADRPLSAMLADVDSFKLLNDTYGHQYGDDCLRRIAQTLATGLRRAADLIARYGGEEFAIILPETPAEHALRHADRLRQQIEDLRIPHRQSPVGEFVTISIGVATVRPREVEQSDLLIQAADLALYQAKRDGRNRVVARNVSS